MPQHVRVDLEAELGLGPGAFHHAGETGRGERRAALAGEHERRLWLLLALEASQRPQLIAQDRMRAGSALLDPADVQGGCFGLDLILTKGDQFGGPQAVPEADQDHGSVPMSQRVPLAA